MREFLAASNNLSFAGTGRPYLWGLASFGQRVLRLPASLAC